MLKKIKKNPDVDTSFLPDREREEADLKLREELRLEWVMTQASLKDEPITVTFSYWDGSGHRRNVTLKKGRDLNKMIFDSYSSEIYIRNKKYYTNRRGLRFYVTRHNLYKDSDECQFWRYMGYLTATIKIFL